MLPAGGPPHTTLANSTATAEGLDYAAHAGLGPDGAPQSGGPRSVHRPALNSPDDFDPVDRIEVRRPTFDVRYVLRDWNGLGSIDSFAEGARRTPTVRSDNPAALAQATPFGVDPTIERGAPGRWDAGLTQPARPIGKV
jgi:hypothetical protein